MVTLDKHVIKFTYTGLLFLMKDTKEFKNVIPLLSKALQESNLILSGCHACGIGSIIGKSINGLQIEANKFNK